MFRIWPAIAALLCGAAAPGQTAPDPTQWASLPVRDLAARLLPPDDAASAIDRQILSDPGGGLRAVRLFQGAESLGRGLCRRKGWYISLDDMKQVSLGKPANPPNASLQLALADDCSSVKSSSWAWVNQPELETPATAALRWLQAEQRGVRTARKSPIAMTCIDRMQTDACKAGARATFAALPLDKIYTIDPLGDFRAPVGWSFSVMPDGPGRPFYDVQLRAGGADEGIAIIHDAPAPF